MFKKNSIFIRLLLPVVLIMLFQAGLIGVVLVLNGSIGALKDSAIESLNINTENHSIILENVMVHNLANLNRLDTNITEIINDYIAKTGLTLDDIHGNAEHETALLYELSNPLVTALRYTSSTGIFMYFIAPEGYIYDTCSYNGLYYRDFDPISTPADNSDILILRGPAYIAEKDGILPDELWSEAFTVSPDNLPAWKSHAAPLVAAAKYPDLTAEDLSYWNIPHLFDAALTADTNIRVTYTRPYFYNGRLIAVIGTAIQESQLKKYFPSIDIDDSGYDGYMLINYESQGALSDNILCDAYSVTGGINRIINLDKPTNFIKGKDGAYTIYNATQPVHTAIKPISLYSENSPFINERWALASVAADSILFEPSRRVSAGIIYGAVIALIAGAALIAAIISFLVRPLNAIVSQINTGDDLSPIVIPGSKIYEADLLCETLNAMREKRREIEARLEEDKERYLMALESAADTLIEYDAPGDTLLVNYFISSERKSEIKPMVIESFTEAVKSGKLFHTDDVDLVLDFIRADTEEPVEVRAKTEMFPYIYDVVPDDGYFWFQLKASYIFDEGHLRKVIGVARQITTKKLKENALVEASYHDTTTGFYNRDYGAMLVKTNTEAAQQSDTEYILCVARLNGYDAFEAHYGRFFSAVVLMRFCNEILSIIDDNIAVRLNNYEFLFYFSGEGVADVKDKLNEMRGVLEDMYTGENPDLALTLYAGLSLPQDDKDYDALFLEAYHAARYAAKNIGAQTVIVNELPPLALTDDSPFTINPISISLDISRDGIVSLAFDLFEHTTDIESVVNILIATLGEMYGLNQIIICSYDADFSVNRVSYQWNAKGVMPHHIKIEKVSQEDIDSLEQKLDENGALIFNAYFTDYFSDGLNNLLCVSTGEVFSAICCAVYESGIHAGRILYKSDDPNRIWSGDEMNNLNEITKIISAHISVQKSNSASRAKSEFLSRMSHEIRTPMNAIIGMTGIAKESISDAERLADCLEKIDFSAKHLLALINDVLEMSRIESGKLQIKDEPFSVASLVSALDILMRPPIEAKGIIFNTHIDCADNNLIGDEYRLKQVLVNFLGNASKFTDPGHDITVSVTELPCPLSEYARVRFSVKDGGIGVSREDQQNIFKAFEQATSEKHIVRQRQGTGLGLAISNNIIAAMGSKIELESELGHGSEFFFVLKLKKAEEIAENTAEEAQEDKQSDYKKFFEGKRVLLVDDNDLNIEIASFILESEGLLVETARNGVEAVDKFFASQPHYFDVILMDIQMPIMDGLTATREIRKRVSREDARTVPIIAMTADAFDEDMKKSIESGMNGHVAKPVDNEKLYATLMQLIGHTQK